MCPTGPLSTVLYYVTTSYDPTLMKVFPTAWMKAYLNDIPKYRADGDSGVRLRV